MSSTYGENLRLTIFGQSHSLAIGMTLEGLPSGKRVNLDELSSFMASRSPGNNAYSTTRKESDTPKFISGLVNGVTCGVPLTAIIENNNHHSQDYELLRHVFRPAHADFTGWVKYGESRDFSGGGHFSGRMTAPLCIAGGICKQLLVEEGITVVARIASIHNICDEGDIVNGAQKLSKLSAGEFPTISESAGEAMEAEIQRAKEEGDSLGGIIECAVLGLPAGLGNPIFDGMENRIASICFGIPAVKGIEFGLGFESTRLLGSESNDSFCLVGDKILTETNNCGGILGGITNGMPLLFKLAVKPTPSISKAQKTVDIESMTETELSVSGRHDPCIVPRAVPVAEAAAAIAIYDALLERKKEL